MVISGRSADNTLVEVIELADHPWFVASQFHPEFKSRPTRPHPLFRDFVGASRAFDEEKQHQEYEAFEREVVGAQFITPELPDTRIEM